MSYASLDTSIHDGDLVELFDFVSDGTTHYRYTSGSQDHEFQGETYTAVALLRSDISVGLLGGQVAEFEIEMPVSLDVVQDHVGIPKGSLEVTVYRFHATETDYAQQWTGRVDGFGGQPPLTSARCISTVDDPLELVLPTVNDQRLCVHVLYDDRCGVDRDDHDLVTAVNGTPSGRTVVVDSVGALDGRLNAGEIVRTSDGARRTIRTQTGTSLVIQSPFRTLADNDAVTLFAGCPHTIDACLDDFDAVVNYGGIPTSYDRTFFDVANLIRFPFGKGGG